MILHGLVLAILASTAWSQCPQSDAEWVQHPRDVDAYLEGVAEDTIVPIDHEFDCNARMLMLQYADSVLDSNPTSHAAVEAALNLTADCSSESGASQQTHPVPPRLYPLPQWAQGVHAGREIYVATDGSDEHGDGSKEHPYATPGRAQQAARGAGAGTTVYFRQGMYAVPAGGLVFTPDDNGKENEPVTYTSYPGEQAVLSGAQALGVLDWKTTVQKWERFDATANVEYEELVEVVDEARIPEEIRQLAGYRPSLTAPGATRIHLLGDGVQDGNGCEALCSEDEGCLSWTLFEKMGGVCVGRKGIAWSPLSGIAGAVSGQYISIMEASVPGLQSARSMFLGGVNEGARATLARFPNGNDTQPWPAGTIQADGGWPENPRGTGDQVFNNVDVYDNGVYMSAGAIPNMPNHTNISVVPPVSIPQANYAKMSCRTFIGVQGGSLDRYNTSTGNFPFWNSAVCDGMFYQAKTFTPRSWVKPSEARVTMRQTHTWGNWGFTIANRWDFNHSMAFSGGGNQEARGGGINKAGSGSGPEGGGNLFYVDGVFEELDAPGEFYFNQSTSTLYYYPRPEDDLSTTPIFIPQIESVVAFRGYPDHAVEYVNVANLTIAHSTVNFYESEQGYEAPPGGDWAVHRGAMVFFDTVRSVSLVGCTVQSPGGNGIMVSNFARDVHIMRNHLSDAAESGVLLLGSTNLFDAYKNPNQPQDTVIANNHVHHVGRIGKQAAPFFHGVSRNNSVLYNVFHSGPRAGINWNDGMHGGSLVEGNLVFNMVAATWDHGPFNSWTRQPWLTPNPGGGLSVVPEVRTLRANFIVNRNWEPGHPSSDKCIDLDDGSTSFLVENNVVLYGGQKMRDGRFRTVQGNLFLYAETHNSGYTTLPGIFLGPNSQSSAHAHYTRSSDVIFNNTYVAVSAQFYSCSSGWTKENFPKITNQTFYVQSTADNLPFSAGSCCSSCHDIESWQRLGHDQGSRISSHASSNASIAMIKQWLHLM